MLRLLLKKELMEGYAQLFFNKKTGQRISGGKLIGKMLLFLLLFIAIAAFSFSMSMLVLGNITDPSDEWAFFAYLIIMSVLLGVIVSAFTAAPALYHAKDNEMLMALPIPARVIVLARLSSIYFTGLMWVALLYIPGLIGFIIFGHPTVAGVICALLFMFILGLFILAVSGFLGWLIGLITSKLKNKSFISVLLSLVFIGAYYYFVVNSNIYQYAIENVAGISTAIESNPAAFPIYLAGKACMGNVLYLLIALAAALLLFGLCYLFISKTFVGIANADKISVSEKKTAVSEKNFESGSIKKALFMKELKGFTSNASYMLNCALGTFIMPVGGILLLIFSGAIREKITLFTTMLPNSVLIIAAVIVGMIGSMNDITAPSISLERDTLWILRSVPIEPKAVFNAKQQLHLTMTVIPALILIVCGGIALQFSFIGILLLAIYGTAFAMTESAVGLLVNLKRPYFKWTNPIDPIKRSGSVFIALFGGWLFNLIFGGIGFVLSLYIEPLIVLAVLDVLMILVVILLNRRLNRKGKERFETL